MFSRFEEAYINIAITLQEKDKSFSVKSCAFQNFVYLNQLTYASRCPSKKVCLPPSLRPTTFTASLNTRLAVLLNSFNLHLEDQLARQLSGYFTLYDLVVQVARNNSLGMTLCFSSAGDSNVGVSC